MRLLILVSLLGAAFAAPKAAPKFGGNRIVGGEETNIQSYPFMSNMQYLVWGLFWSQYCGGSLITPTTVVSAAHCYEGDHPSEWRVKLGSSFASSGGHDHPVSQLIIHERYDSQALDNDVAIVRLATPAQMSDSVGMARIAGENYIVPDGTVLTAIGWGSLSSGGSYPETLRHVDINQINQELCAERYAYLKSQPGFQNWPDITPGMICAGILDVGGKDACQGDSGGPLAHNGDVLIGITSWGYSCAHPEYPGVSARVSHFSDWIVENGSG